MNIVFFVSNIVCCCTIYLHKMSGTPKGDKQAPKVAKKGENMLEKRRYNQCQQREKAQAKKKGKLWSTVFP